MFWLLKEKLAYISIEFIKVPAHSGIEYNEAADDWKAVIDLINGENEELTGGTNETISVSCTTVNGNR